jgi:hypothetical protein
MSRAFVNVQTDPDPLRAANQISCRSFLSNTTVDILTLYTTKCPSEAFKAPTQPLSKKEAKL